MISLGKWGISARVRIALGASPATVVRMVLQRGLTLAGLGIAIGVAAAFGLTRLLAAMLYGVGPADPPTLAGVAALLAAVALLACYLPARRASRIDPVSTLRQE